MVSPSPESPSGYSRWPGGHGEHGGRVPVRARGGDFTTLTSRFPGPETLKTRVTSTAPTAAAKADHRAQLIYRTRAGPGSGTHQRKSFTETDYARMLEAAHQHFARPIVLVWITCPHTSRAMRQADRGPLVADGLPALGVRRN